MDKKKDARHRYYLDNIESEKAYAAQNRYKYAETIRLNQRASRRDLRQQVIDKLGGKCVECGIDNPLVLQVDHKLGGGYRERREPGMSNGSTRKYLMKILLDNTDRYQLLCANHNILKYRTHQK